MSEVRTLGNFLRNTSVKVVVLIIVVGLFLLLMLHFGLTRYYNARELDSLIDRAEAEGKEYSVIIHNNLTGRYSFNVE